jgi:glutamate-1-semialdehyde aminotransferase/acyl carrier protein
MQSSNSQRDQLITDLADSLEESSGLELSVADAKTPFLELGLDSLFLTQFALALGRKFKIKVTFRQLLEHYPTMDALAAHIEATLPPESRRVEPPKAAPAAPAAAPQPASRVPAAIATAPAMVARAPATVRTALPSLSAPTAPPGTMQNLIEQQLRLMAQQLALLGGARVQTASPVVVASAVPELAVTAQPAAPAPVAEPATQPAPAAAATAEAGPQSERPAGPMKYDVKTAFGAIARIATAKSDEVTPKQQARLDAFIRRYNARTKKSKDFAQANRRVFADPRVVTGFKPATKELVYPIVVERSAGSRLWDIDGNEYVDALNGFGMNLFGWQPEFVTKAIEAQLHKGHEIGPTPPLAPEVARLLCEFTGFDRAAFCNTGSEAVMGCMRIARTVTGRSKIAIFTGSYHGIFDEVVVRGTKKLRAIPAAPGIMPESAQNMLVLDYGTPESLEILKAHADELAAIVVEPVQSRRPDFQPKEFLHALRELTTKHGIVYVFDEVVTGFRRGPGGAQEYFGVKADLASYGKVIGGGLPFGVIAGKAEFMDALDGGYWEFGDDSSPPVGVTYFAGTFCRHPLALAAAKASLTHLKERGPSLQKDLNDKTTAFVEGLNGFLESVGAPIKIKHFGSLWKTFFTEDQPFADILTYMLRDRGVHIYDGFPCFFTTAHSDADFAFIAKAYRESVEEMQNAGFLPERKAPAKSVGIDASAPPIAGARLGRDPSGNPAWYAPHPSQPGQYVKIDGGGSA